MSIPFRPRESDAHVGLKQLKDGYDNPAFDRQELFTEFAVRNGNTNALRAYRGEFLHQLALRRERRGEIAKATQLYRASMAELSDNPLGSARTLRDYGTMIGAYVDSKRGIDMVKEALALHDHDLDNEKGRRQRRITESYLWRAQMLAGRKDSRTAERLLIELVQGPDFDFCTRDRQVIIDFLIPRTRGLVHRELLTLQAAIMLERNRHLQVVRSYIMLVIDIELTIAGSIARKVLRRD